MYKCINGSRLSLKIFGSIGINDKRQNRGYSIDILLLKYHIQLDLGHNHVYIYTDYNAVTPRNIPPRKGTPLSIERISPFPTHTHTLATHGRNVTRRRGGERTFNSVKACFRISEPISYPSIYTPSTLCSVYGTWRVIRIERIHYTTYQ